MTTNNFLKFLDRQYPCWQKMPTEISAIHLKTCLQGLEKQNYPISLYEVIVVDNGADENSEPMVAGFSRAKVSLELHFGSFAARKKGITLARGDVLAFIDDDCIPAADLIERGVAKLLSFPNWGIIWGKRTSSFKTRRGRRWRNSMIVSGILTRKCISKSYTLVSRQISLF